MHKTVPLDNLPTETTVQYFSWCEGICDLFCSLFRLSIQMFLLSTAPVQMYVVVLATFGLVLFLWQTGGFKRICIYKMYIFSITMVLPPYFFCQWNFHMHKKVLPVKKNGRRQDMVLHFQLQRQHKYLWWVYFHTS